MHRSSPAISQMALLEASLALVEKLSAGACEGSGLDAQRSFGPLTAADLPLIRSWFRSFRVSLRIAARTAMDRPTRPHLLVEQWSIGVADTHLSSTSELFPRLHPPRDLHWIEPGAR